MIIQIRGTSGSGKTWVMREVISSIGGKSIPRYQDGRKKPLWYSIDDLAILGHYESPCGGCDNIGSARQVYELIREVQPKVNHIVCEGLLLSEDVKWSSQLEDLRVVYLTTPIDRCIELIKKRRIDAGNPKPLNESNTRKRVRIIERSRVKLMENGIYCRRVSSRQAPSLILRWLRLHA